LNIKIGEAAQKKGCTLSAHQGKGLKGSGAGSPSRNKYRERRWSWFKENSQKREISMNQESEELRRNKALTRILIAIWATARPKQVLEFFKKSQANALEIARQQNSTQQTLLVGGAGSSG